MGQASFQVTRMTEDSVELKEQIQLQQAWKSASAFLLPHLLALPAFLSLQRTFLTKDNSHSQGEGICSVKLVTVQWGTPTDCYHRFQDQIHNLWTLLQNENVDPLTKMESFKTVTAGPAERGALCDCTSRVPIKSVLVG